MSDTHGAADSFDTEFEAARAAEADAPDDAPEPADDAAPVAAAAVEKPAEEKPALDAETTAKRLADTQTALKKERADKRELASRVAALEAAREAKPAAAEPAAKADEMPDPNVDPIGALEYVQKLIKSNQAKSAEQTAAQTAQQRNVEAFKVVQTAMSDAEEDFRVDHPDYDEAAEHFAKSHKEELAESGLSGAELDQALADALTRVVARALQAKKDPAEIVYNLAKRRGFGAAAKENTENPVDKVATKLQTIAEGQEAAKSVGAGGAGGGGGGNLTYAAVANLKGAAFDAAFDKLRAAERRAG